MKSDIDDFLIFVGQHLLVCCFFPNFAHGRCTNHKNHPFMFSKWRLYVSLLVAFMPLMAWGDDFSTPSFSVETEVVTPNKKTFLTVMLTNPGEEKYNGYQFDLRLPNGFELVEDDSGFEYELSGRYSTKRVNVSINERSSGNYRLMCYSFNNTVITGNEGPLIKLYFKADDNVEDGLYEGSLVNALLSRNDGNSVNCPKMVFEIQVGETTMGDVNIDYVVDVADAMKTVMHILKVEQKDFHFKYADMDGNGMVDVADVMAIVDIILRRQ